MGQKTATAVSCRAALELVRKRPGGDSFELAPMGALLADGSPQSLRHWTIWWGAHLWPVWGKLLYSVQTGSSARRSLTGRTGFGHLEGERKAGCC